MSRGELIHGVSVSVTVVSYHSPRLLPFALYRPVKGSKGDNMETEFGRSGTEPNYDQSDEGKDGRRDRRG